MLTCDLYQENETRKLFTCNLPGVSAGCRGVPETTEFIDVQNFPGEIAAPVTLDCILSYKELEFKEKIKVYVKPSKQPVLLRLYEIGADGTEVEMERETNRELEERMNLVFKLFDGLNTLVPFDSSKHKLSFVNNWPERRESNSSKVIYRVQKLAKMGQKVKTTVEFKLPNGTSKSLHHKFYINTKPSDPYRMDVRIWNPVKNEQNGRPNAQPIPSRIQIPIDEKLVNALVTVADQHGNVVKEGMDLEYISEIGRAHV